MNIFVCVKQVPDSRSEIKANINANDIETEHISWDINPEDECAMEQALLIREQITDTSITAIRVGEKQDNEALISALAMGADDAILVNTSGQQLDPFLTARALKNVIEQSNKKADLVLCGNKSFGDESGEVPQMLAQMLNLPCLNKVSRCCIDKNELYLERIIENGIKEKYLLYLPAVIACSYGINTPRYAAFPHIQSAYKKPFSELDLQAIGIKTNQSLIHYSNYRLLPENETGDIFYANDQTKIDAVIPEIVDILDSMNLLPENKS